MDLPGDCTNCPFARDGKPPHRPVWGTGPKYPRGVVVAESPGDDEVETGVPLTGPTGREFDRELQAARIRREELFILNTVLCQPPRTKTEADMHTAVKCCERPFRDQLSRLDSNLPVLAMGRWAHLALRGTVRSIEEERGFVRREWTLRELRASEYEDNDE